MGELVDLARRKGLWLVEDAAHAHGSSHDGTPAGGFGLAAAFSFYPTKLMTSAEGGMIVTRESHLAEEARIYRDQGKASFGENAHLRLGYNWRMSEPHAIIGLRHLDRLPAMIADRQHLAAAYLRELGGDRPFRPLPVPPGGVCNYYKFVLVLSARRDRPALKRALKERYGVSLAGEVYEVPLHAQPVFRAYAGTALPAAEDLCARHICLPIFSGMDEGQVRQVLRALRETIG
jgi:dTDP-4-amino-4,6-dideoxygalactose transaminase